MGCSAVKAALPLCRVSAQVLECDAKNEATKKFLTKQGARPSEAAIKVIKEAEAVQKEQEELERLAQERTKIAEAQEKASDPAYKELMLAMEPPIDPVVKARAARKNWDQAVSIQKVSRGYLTRKMLSDIDNEEGDGDDDGDDDDDEEEDEVLLPRIIGQSPEVKRLSQLPADALAIGVLKPQGVMNGNGEAKPKSAVYQMKKIHQIHTDPRAALRNADFRDGVATQNFAAVKGLHEKVCVQRRVAQPSVHVAQSLDNRVRTATCCEAVVVPVVWSAHGTAILEGLLWSWLGRT